MRSSVRSSCGFNEGWGLMTGTFYRKGAKGTKDAKEEHPVLLFLCVLGVLCAFAVRILPAEPAFASAKVAA